MKIFYVRDSKHKSWGYFGAVVVAETKKQAIEVASIAATCSNDRLVAPVVEALGTAFKKYKKPEILLRDYSD